MCSSSSFFFLFFNTTRRKWVNSSGTVGVKLPVKFISNVGATLQVPCQFPPPHLSLSLIFSSLHLSSPLLTHSLVLQLFVFCCCFLLMCIKFSGPLSYTGLSLCYVKSGYRCMFDIVQYLLT